MPSDDLVLSVRQIAQYTAAGSAPTNASLLMQLGIGGPYLSISPQALVGTALATGGGMSIAGPLSVQAIAGGSAQFSNGTFNVLSAQKACIVDFAATWGTIAGVPIATVNNLSDLDTAIRAASVWSFNGRVGDVRLWIDDIRCAGGAPIFSPRFEGSPRACTPDPSSNSSRLATTAFVTNAVGTAFASYAPLDSPNFSGIPTAPTAALGTSTGQLATTAFVMEAVADSTTGVVSFNGRSGLVVLLAADVTALGFALLASPTFTGTPQAPTAGPGTNTAQLATCAFVEAAVAAATAGVASFNGRTGTVTLTAADVAAVGVSSFNGRIGAVSLIANDISAAGGAVLASPIFTGTPTAPTAAPATATAQLATCAFVAAAIAAIPAQAGPSTANPAMDGTATPGVLNAWSRGDHVHPSDTSRLPLVGGAGSSMSGPLYFNASPAVYDTYTSTARLWNNGTSQMTFDSGGNLTIPGGYSGVNAALSGTLSALTANLSSATIGGIVMGGAGGLSSSGTLTAGVFQTSGTGGVVINAGGSLNYIGTIFMSGGNLICTNDGSSCGVPGQAWAQCAAYAFAQQSDARGKTDIAASPPGALDAVGQIPVHDFSYRTRTSGRQIGWLAQEVQDVKPGNVLVGEDADQTLAVDLGAMLATLWQAVQELTAKVATLEAT
jgi:Chaperone of endosialidase